VITWGALTDLINNAKGLAVAPTLFLVFSNRDLQVFAMELNTGDPNISGRGQLFLEGVDSKGRPLGSIGGEYSDFTISVKEATGLPFDRVTLYQEGDFYKTWKFIQHDDSFILRADTIKDGKDLRERWGDDIIGLTNESISELALEALPYVIDEVRRALLR
jgi:hypothetical protein